MGSVQIIRNVFVDIFTAVLQKCRNLNCFAKIRYEFQVYTHTHFFIRFKFLKFRKKNPKYLENNRLCKSLTSEVLFYLVKFNCLWRVKLGKKLKIACLLINNAQGSLDAIFGVSNFFFAVILSLHPISKLKHIFINLEEFSLPM